MAGLVPAIHALLPLKQDVDARDKRGHDVAIGATRLREPPYSAATVGFDAAAPTPVARAAPRRRS
jgi:hypothetical protein